MEIWHICDVFEEELKKYTPMAEDRDYCIRYRKCIEGALRKGIITYPKTEEELREEAHDIVFGNAVGPYMKFPGDYILGETGLTYNVKDSQASDEEISTRLEMLYKLRENLAQGLGSGKWRPLHINIYLTLEKGGDIDKIDEYFERVFKKIKSIPNSKIQNIVVNFGEETLKDKTVRYLLDEKGLQNLVKLQKVVKENGGKLLFRELPNSLIYWDFMQLIKANKCINDLAQTVKDNHLSPFEALLFISTWAQKNIKYYEGKDTFDEDTNTIVGAINNQKTRCVGFSQFVEAVVTSLENYYNNENSLKCNGIMSVAYDRDYLGRKKFYISDHSQSRHFVKDKKYGMNGEVIVDPLGVSRKVDVRKIDGDITLFSLSPISTFSRLKQTHKQYKIYSGDYERSEINWEDGFLFPKCYVDGKAQRQVLKETRQNAKEAKRLQQNGITLDKYREAYSKIIPLVFPNARAGDIIAPVLAFHDEDGSVEYNKTINLSRDRDREFWDSVLKGITQSQIKIRNGENELY